MACVAAELSWLYSVTRTRVKGVTRKSPTASLAVHERLERAKIDCTSLQFSSQVLKSTRLGERRRVTRAECHDCRCGVRQEQLVGGAARVVPMGGTPVGVALSQVLREGQASGGRKLIFIGLL